MLSAKDRKNIAARARTLAERIDGRKGADLAGDSVQISEIISQSDVERWKQVVADGDSSIFDARLALAQSNRLNVSTHVQTDSTFPSGSNSVWVSELETMLTYVCRGTEGTLPFEIETQLPFEEILRSIVVYGCNGVDISSSRVTNSAVGDLAESLALRIKQLWARPLFIEFKTYIGERTPDLVFDESVSAPEGSKRYYDEFIKKLQDGGIREFCVEYAFLSRLTVTVVQQWIDRLTEFVSRVEEDWVTIGETFETRCSPGVVTAIQTFGDYHQGGREVLSVTFDSGLNLAYKPRNSGLASGFYQFIEWINMEGELPDLRTLESLSRDNYAWIEWVTSQPCDTTKDVAEYYERAGMFLCLFYGFGATDMHLENVISEADQPVLIDLETLAEPMASSEYRVINETVKVVADTVVRTGAVPRYDPNRKGGDLSGFSGRSENLVVDGEQFVNINTDNMDLKFREFTGGDSANLPKYDGKKIGVESHTDDLFAGFERMYHFLLSYQNEILANDGPLSRAFDEDAEIRVVYRSTSLYSRILKAISSPSSLRRGLDFSFETERLVKLIVSGDVDPAVWNVYLREKETLQAYNTPRFTVTMDSVTLFDGNIPVINNFFDTSPRQQIFDRISNLSLADLDEQLEYLKRGYSSKQHNRLEPPRDEISDTAKSSGIDDSIVLDTAINIFSRMMGSARIEMGHPTWILRETGPEGGLYIHPISHRLYDGRVGPAIFAAGLYHVTGEQQFQSAASRIVEPLMEELDEGAFVNPANDRQNPPRPLGGATGLGSIAYGLLKVAQLLGNDRYSQASELIAKMINIDRIEHDAAYDIMQGSAGAILGLLSLYESTDNEATLQNAIVAGEHICDEARPGSEQEQWSIPGSDSPLCGFSHGAAGIGYAMARLGEQADETQFLSAAESILGIERSQYDPDLQNWPDHRRGSDPDWVDGWCHGRSGIGLARVGTYRESSLRTTQIREEIRAAADGVDEAHLFDTDHVCCGNFARVEFLLEASSVLDEPAYRRQAERIGRAALDREELKGRFQTKWQSEYWHNPGFFTGEVGIGYTLLRLIDPTLPSVLLWE